MSGNHFLLPFREQKRKKIASPIGLTLLMFVTIIFMLLVPADLVNPTVDVTAILNILLIYSVGLVSFLLFRGSFVKTLRVVLSAFLIIFTLGIPSFFLKQGPIMFQIPIRSIYFSFYATGVNRALFIWLRGLCSVSIVTLYTTTLTVQEFIQSLRSLFVPNILVTLILLILRYTPMFFEQGSEIKTAQELRGMATAPYRRKFAAATARLGGTLIRSVQKGSQVYEAMVLRGLESSELVRRLDIKWLDLILVPILASCFSMIVGGVIPWSL